MGALDKLRELNPGVEFAAPSRNEIASEVNVRVDKRKSIYERISRGEVEWSPDFQRILALPRREKPDLVHLSKVMTERLRKPGGTQELWAYQAWVLWEFPVVGGGLGFLEVSAGKCVHSSTEVFDASSGMRRTAGDVGRFTTPAMKSDGRIENFAASSFLSGEKQCLTLTLADGSTVILSSDHPVYTARGWVHAGLLQHDDLVATPRSIPAPQTPLTVSDEEVMLAAYLIADGSMTTGTPVFTDDNTSTVEEVFRLAEALANPESRAQGPYEKKQRSKAREISLRGLSWFVRKWGLKELSKHKRVPAEFWGLNNRQLALFLNRFTACDGHLGHHEVEITLASEGLVDDLRFMLLRLGVMSRKKFKNARIGSKEFPAYRLSISGVNVDRFFEQVGVPVGCEKRAEKLQAYRADLQSKDKTNVDLVPFGSEEFKILCDELGLWKTRSKLRNRFGVTVGQQLSRSKFEQLCRETRYQGRFKHFAENDLAWEKITSVEDAGFHPVYDLSVPGPTSFIGNNIVLHNTLAGLLMPMVMPNCERAVLLVPAQLKAQLFERDLDEYGKHWHLPNVVGRRGFIAGRPSLKVISYSELQQTTATDLLKYERADLIIGDEVDNLRNRNSARSIRFLNFFQNFPSVRFIGWSGSLTADSISDYSHLLALALDAGSPLPVENSQVKSWGRVLDASNEDREFVDPGVLYKFCKPGEDISSGYRRRLVDTPGVVASEGTSIPSKMIFFERPAPEMPKHLTEHLQILRRRPSADGWKRPDGEFLIEAVQVRECALQLASGFYYHWVYPRNEPLELRKAWFAARQNFNRELRAQLLAGIPYLESPKLCEDAADRWFDGGCSNCHREPREDHKRGCNRAFKNPLWPSATWLSWKEIKDQVYHEQEAVWESDYLVRDIAEWAKEPGIVWVGWTALGHTIAKATGLPYFGEGKAASSEILKEDGKRSIIVSMNAHKHGKNLQREFWRNLVIPVPAGDLANEQMLGRTHRRGQPSPFVEGHLYLHTAELRDSLYKAKDKAKYIFRTTGGDRKLVYGDFSSFQKAVVVVPET